MIKLIINILLFSFSKSFGQDYVAHWKTIGKELDVVNYQVQISNSPFSGYLTINGATIAPQRLPDSNWYSYALPEFTGTKYFKVKALKKDVSVFTTPIKITIIPNENENVSITNAVVKIQTSSDNLSFNATNESAVDYYIIERKNNNNNTWTLVGKLTQKGQLKYVVNISKSGINRKYRMKSIYKNGLQSQYINFL